MKAIILAAGFGNRMKPLTDSTHKTLIEVAGRSIIDRIVDGLLANNIRNILVVTGYLAKELSEHLLRTFPTVNFEFVENKRYRESNNIYSMSLALNNTVIDSDIILIESDLIYEPQVIKRIVDTKYANAALVCKYRSGLDGTVVALSGDRIIDVIPGHRQTEKFDFSDKYKTLNIYRFSKEFCNNEFKKLLTFYANIIDDNCYYELIVGILIYMQREQMYVEIVEDEKWAEVDDPNDLRLAEFTFAKDRQKEILESSFGGFWNYDVLDFCYIRNMYFPTPNMLSEINNNLPKLIYNYGSRQSILEEKLSYVLECNAKGLVALNGAAQVYPILRGAFAGKRVLIPSPTFGEYARVFPNAKCYEDTHGINGSDFSKRVNGAEVVIIVNPNNPSGTLFPSDAVMNLAKAHKNKLFVIDESFIEFSDDESVLMRLKKEPLPNILIIKSLSKSYGCPGLRLGAAYSSNVDLIAQIRAEVPVWNLNSISEFFLEIVLKNKKALKDSFTRTKADRAEFRRLLLEVPGVQGVSESNGNFILVKLDGKKFGGSKLQDYLIRTHSIYVKDLSSRYGDGHCYIRLAVRLPVEHDFLVKCLRQYGAN